MRTLFIILSVSAFLGFYSLLSQLLLPVSGGSKALKRIKEQQKERQSSLTVLLEPAVKALARILHLKPYQKNRMEAAFKKAGIKMTAEEFKAQALIKAALIAVSGIVFILVGIPITAGGCVFLSVAVYFNENSKIEKEVQRTVDEILKELPRFVRTVIHGLRSGMNIIEVVQAYRKVAGKALGAELDILVAGLETGNASEALKKFAQRISIDRISDIVSALISVERGINQEMYFILMEESMKTLARENIRKEIQRRPSKFKLPTLTVAGCGILMYIAPIVYSMAKGFMNLN